MQYCPLSKIYTFSAAFILNWKAESKESIDISLLTTVVPPNHVYHIFPLEAATFLIAESFHGKFYSASRAARWWW